MRLSSPFLAVTLAVSLVECEGSSDDVQARPQFEQASVDGGQNKLRFEDVFDNLFVADIDDNSVSVYYEVSNGFSGEELALQCTGSSGSEVSVSGPTRSNLELSARQRFVFRLRDMDQGSSCVYDLRYADSPIALPDSIHVLRASTRKSSPPSKTLIVADMHGENFGTVLSRMKLEVEDSTALVSLGDSILADHLAASRDYIDIWYRDIIQELKSITGAVPFYPVVGNHDIGNFRGYFGAGREAFLELFELPKSDEQERTYYSFETGGIHFVVLDGVECSIEEEQMVFLKEQLKTSSAPFAVVLLHYQIYGCELNPTQGGPIIVDPSIEELHLLLRSHNVKLVLNGHRHYYGVYLKDGIYYIAVPTAVPEQLIPQSDDDPRIFDQENGESVVYDDRFYGYATLEAADNRMVFTPKGYRESSDDFTILDPIVIE